MRILLASIVCDKGDLDTNLVRHRRLLGEARQAGCELAVFPEFSLTGSVDPVRHPERAIKIDDPAIQAMTAATRESAVGALFGFGERNDGEFFITQAYAAHGDLVGIQRKRHLGDDEKGFAVGVNTASFTCGPTRFGVVICAEAGVDFTWDRSVAAGASLVLMCSAPGLYGRRTDEQSWRAGFQWWEECGLGDARRHAARLGVWVGMATQAGSTADEDFPGIAALVDPTGSVTARLPDWRAGTLVVDVPVISTTERTR